MTGLTPEIRALLVDAERVVHWAAFGGPEPDAVSVHARLHEALSPEVRKKPREWERPGDVSGPTSARPHLFHAISYLEVAFRDAGRKPSSRVLAVIASAEVKLAVAKAILEDDVRPGRDK